MMDGKSEDALESVGEAIFEAAGYLRFGIACITRIENGGSDGSPRNAIA